ncbi:helix-turn-helix transcriptional regulator [Halosquirtibacter laminarini]|uniref:Helix-turn-helix transcriptional regulator n=1 Tax=Halosquirtibacter laminarini TaxID=3374600 RepID=A0AC61NI73_9BACT|nr:helix-turn-helix transcriptional regulator [Prolixibacteraceae bacterium]
MIDRKNKLPAKTPFKIAPFRKHIRKTKAHIHHGYLEIVFLHSAKGTHTIDEQAYPTTQPSIFVITYGQVHHWDILTEPSGFVILIQKDFLDLCQDPQLESLTQNITEHDCIPLSYNETIHQLFSILYQERNSLNTHFRDHILKALYTKVLEHAPTHKTANPNRQDYHHFFLLVNKHHKKEKKVQFYAFMMNTTPQNLNAICRKAVGFTASQIIADVTIKEAKRQIKYTQHSVSEIAYNLNFKDPSHFVKYFKRYTQTTPNEFRNKS